MKVECKRHIGTLPSGKQVEFHQWMVYADGKHVAILDHECKFPLMPTALLIGQPADVMQEIVEKCSKITGKQVEPPTAIYIPPEIDNSKGEDGDN